MNRIFKTYLIIWLIAVAIFNVTCFAIPEEYTAKFSGSYWIGYVFLLLAHVCLLVCCYFTFKRTYLKELFYNVPIILLAYAGLVAMTVIGSASMLVRGFPIWLAVILCFALLGIIVMIALTAGLNAQAMTDMDGEQQRGSFSVRQMTSHAEVIMDNAVDPELKKTAKSVYDALKYSDPVSNIMLTKANERISRELRLFEEAVKDGDTELAGARSISVLDAISERNAACKTMK